MKTGILPLGLLATVLLTTCGADAASQNFEWFKTHDKERQAKIEECKKATDPRGNEDCRNTIDASFASGTFTKS
ncbi:EexN family lipoprotein [Rahnella sp. SAP-1]|uniref:EexN family lipoprotein n=1 Tax=Rouxiella aceris TaxID=2703884 RepID=A0A848MGH2_9GAMM|nr:EexN family lipoprotein [Rouxiella aceris]NMP26233.1 EexN family lipoprotein [Rouxiella aceris]